MVLIVVATAALELSTVHASMIAPHGAILPRRPVAVPDSGSTAAFLGLALVGVALLRRRLTRV
jgi:hypothetical protein